MKKIYFSMMALAIAAFTFTSCEDVPEPYNNPYDQIKPSEPEVVIEPAGSGTAEDPYNVAAIIEQTASLADGEFFNNSNDVYVTGVVVETKEVSAQYGNATYYIADNAKSADRFYVYRGKLLDGASVAAETDLEVGDSVTVCGKIKNYKGTLEFDQGNYLTFIKKGQGGGGDKPSTDEVGSKDAPKSVTEALAAINAMEDGATSTEFWYVKGKVVKVTTNQASFDQYKNLNYLISEDGTESNTITVYAGNGLDNTQFSGIDALKQGDEVVVYGHIQKYVKNDKMTPEIAKGNYLVKYTAAGGQGGGEGGAKGSGTQADPFNVAGVINATASLGTGEFYNNGAEVYVSGIVTETKDINTQYGNATYYISDDKSASNKFYVFRGKLLDGASVTAETDLQVGDEVTVCGKIKNYNGTIEFDQGNYLTALKKGEGGSEGGGEGTKVTSLTNGDFESWADGIPTGWKSASSASSATLSQSTDAHGGTYSVNVNGNESANKRLASQEITLAAGTYTFSFWAKATTSDTSQARPGFVPVTDGTVGSYTYGDYATLSTSWQKINYEFTLTAETTVCLVVMNPKKSSYSSGKDILIDDASLTKK